MLTSLALIFLCGLGAAAVCQRIGLPRIIGMLLTGILLGPYVFGLLDSSILGISAELRRMALVIILIRAGLSLDLSDLKKVGRPAVMLSFLPASFEIMAFLVFAPVILGVSRVEAAVMGAVLAAVSPAVVVPRMVELIDKRYGTEQGIPQMILAGASLDDVFVIVLFSTFTGMAQGGSASVGSFLQIPVSIGLGLLLGACVGRLTAAWFGLWQRRGHLIGENTGVLLLLGIAFLLLWAEDALADVVSISGLLAIMSMAIFFARRSSAAAVQTMKGKFGAVWTAAEVLLFVLVGAVVDIRFTMEAGAGAVLMIALGLLIRSVGTALCVSGTPLDRKERLFCVIAYLPKATVQAAIGSVPLALGLPCGPIVLSVAVLGILITAPLGAIGMDKTYQKCLKKEKPR